MALKIKVYSDYVCPYCFLAEKPLKEAIQGKPIEIEWMPFELRPFPNPTLRPEGEYLQNTWANSVYPMGKEMGIPIILPKISPQPHTHLAFEGYQYAKENGKANEYNDRILGAFFQEEQDIGDIEVLTKLAAEIGLNAKEFSESLESRKYQQAHRAALQEAFKANIRAVPTFIIGNSVLRGIYPKEVLERVVNEELSGDQSQ